MAAKAFVAGGTGSWEEGSLIFYVLPGFALGRGCNSWLISKDSHIRSSSPHLQQMKMDQESVMGLYNRGHQSLLMNCIDWSVKQAFVWLRNGLLLEIWSSCF